jgi:hypothetical protein
MSTESPLAPPSNEKIHAAFKEEQDAAIAFAEVLRKEGKIDIEKRRAHYRLTMARAAKMEILQDLMYPIS